MRKILKAVTAAVVMLGMIGCSSGPSTSDIKAQITTSLASNVVEVVSVTILDKQEYPNLKDALAVKYEAEVRMKANYLDLRQKVLKMSMSRSFESMIALGLLRDEYGTFKAGEVKKTQSAAIFVKTDAGWKIVGI